MIKIMNYIAIVGIKLIVNKILEIMREKINNK